MNLHDYSFTELQGLFHVVFRDWRENNFEIERVKKKECEKYRDFVRNRADLRHLSRVNSELHNKLVQIELEMQIRVWSGKND